MAFQAGQEDDRLHLHTAAFTLFRFPARWTCVRVGPQVEGRLSAGGEPFAGAHVHGAGRQSFLLRDVALDLRKSRRSASGLSPSEPSKD